MAVQIVRSVIRPARRDEYIVMMDDYGAEFHLTLPITCTPAERAAAIAAKQALHARTQAQMESYAAAAHIDLSGLKAAGEAKRAALLQAAAAARKQS